eukprot:23897_1
MVRLVAWIALLQLLLCQAGSDNCKDLEYKVDKMYELVKNHFEPSNPDAPRDYFRLRNKEGLCLVQTSHGSIKSDGCRSDGPEYELWKFDHNRIKNKKYHECIKYKQGGQVTADKCKDRKSRKWEKYDENHDGYFMLKNQNTGKCIYHSGGYIGAASCSTYKGHDLFYWKVY